MNKNLELHVINEDFKIDISNIKETEEKVYNFLYELTDSDYNGINFFESKEFREDNKDYGLRIAINKFSNSTIENNKININKLINFIKNNLYDAYDDNNYYRDIKVSINYTELNENEYFIVCTVSTIIQN